MKNLIPRRFYLLGGALAWSAAMGIACLSGTLASGHFGAPVAVTVAK